MTSKEQTSRKRKRKSLIFTAKKKRVRLAPTLVTTAEECCFCHSGEDSEYGAFFKNEELKIAAHQFCLLFSSGLPQRGDDSEGFDGFLLKDVFKEAQRSSILACKFCNEFCANSGCCKPSCRTYYHYKCGLKHGIQFIFDGSFNSFCPLHRSYQDLSWLKCVKGELCPICLDGITDTNASVESILKTPCCKNVYIHRACVQRQASISGYFFRCPTCNNDDKFAMEMSRYGIYIPSRDAAWEESNAYSELLEQYNKCDLKKCKCKNGRKYFTKAGQWHLIRCYLCGQSAVHVKCLGTHYIPGFGYVCVDCNSVARMSTSSANVILQPSIQERWKEHNRRLLELTSRDDPVLLASSVFGKKIWCKKFNIKPCNVHVSKLELPSKTTKFKLNKDFYRIVQKHRQKEREYIASMRSSTSATNTNNGIESKIANPEPESSHSEATLVSNQCDSSNVAVDRSQCGNSNENVSVIELENSNGCYHDKRDSNLSATTRSSPRKKLGSDSTVNLQFETSSFSKHVTVAPENEECPEGQPTLQEYVKGNEALQTSLIDTDVDCVDDLGNEDLNNLDDLIYDALEWHHLKLMFKQYKIQKKGEKCGGLNLVSQVECFKDTSKEPPLENQQQIQPDATSIPSPDYFSEEHSPGLSPGFTTIRENAMSPVANSLLLLDLEEPTTATIHSPQFEAKETKTVPEEKKTNSKKNKTHLETPQFKETETKSTHPSSARTAFNISFSKDSFCIKGRPPLWISNVSAEKSSRCATTKKTNVFTNSDKPWTVPTNPDTGYQLRSIGSSKGHEKLNEHKKRASQRTQANILVDDSQNDDIAANILVDDSQNDDIAAIQARRRSLRKSRISFRRTNSFVADSSSDTSSGDVKNNFLDFNNNNSSSFEDEGPQRTKRWNPVRKSQRIDSHRKSGTRHLRRSDDIFHSRKNSSFDEDEAKSPRQKSRRISCSRSNSRTIDSRTCSTFDNVKKISIAFNNNSSCGEDGKPLFQFKRTPRSKEVSTAQNDVSGNATKKHLLNHIRGSSSSKGENAGESFSFPHWKLGTTTAATKPRQSINNAYLKLKTAAPTTKRSIDGNKVLLKKGTTITRKDSEEEGKSEADPLDKAVLNVNAKMKEARNAVITSKVSSTSSAKLPSASKYKLPSTSAAKVPSTSESNVSQNESTRNVLTSASRSNGESTVDALYKLLQKREQEKEGKDKSTVTTYNVKSKVPFTLSSKVPSTSAKIPSASTAKVRSTSTAKVPSTSKDKVPSTLTTKIQSTLKVKVPSILTSKVPSTSTAKVTSTSTPKVSSASQTIVSQSESNKRIAATVSTAQATTNYSPFKSTTFNSCSSVNKHSLNMITNTRNLRPRTPKKDAPETGDVPVATRIVDATVATKLVGVSIATTFVDTTIATTFVDAIIATQSVGAITATKKFDATVATKPVDVSIATTPVDTPIATKFDDVAIVTESLCKSSTSNNKEKDRSQEQGNHSNQYVVDEEGTTYEDFLPVKKRRVVCQNFHNSHLVHRYHIRQQEWTSAKLEQKIYDNSQIDVIKC